MFGLNKKDMDFICECISHQALVERAVVFGSRAMGNYKKGSDIDIAIFGKEVTNREQSFIIDELEESTLPYEVDLVIYEKIENEKLRQHIMEYGIEIYSKKT